MTRIGLTTCSLSSAGISSHVSPNHPSVSVCVSIWHELLLAFFCGHQCLSFSLSFFVCVHDACMNVSVSFFLVV